MLWLSDTLRIFSNYVICAYSTVVVILFIIIRIAQELINLFQDRVTKYLMHCLLIQFVSRVLVLVLTS